MRFPEPPRALDPRRIPFSSTLHSQKNAAILGTALGVSFFLCFFTGLFSHLLQNPVSWWTISPRPAGLYRVNQGLHVLSGVVAVPLLLAKLWVVFPRLFQWPPVKNVAQVLERLSLLPLIGGALFQLISGIANISQWYFFPFFFTTTHFAMAWVVIGALIVHIGAKATIAATQFRRPAEAPSEAPVSRRAFLGSVFGVGGVIAVFSVGQSFSPFGSFAFLAPRKPGVGPQNLPVNKTAAGAGVAETARAADYTLLVSGVAQPMRFTLEDLRAMPQHSAELPIACVEGWSASAMWSGVRVRDLMRMAGAGEGASARVESLEESGAYRTSDLNFKQAADRDTLLALDLNGSPLDIDHGYPVRLISPNRPGVMQTKWVNQLVIT